MNLAIMRLRQPAAGGENSLLQLRHGLAEAEVLQCDEDAGAGVGRRGWEGVP